MQACCCKHSGALAYIQFMFCFIHFHPFKESSAILSFSIFSLFFSRMFFCSPDNWCPNICATCLATFATLSTSEFELPGGLEMQDTYSAPGGQLTTGWTLKNESTPESASVPPATDMKTTGSTELLYFMTSSSHADGCLCAEHILICDLIPYFPSSAWIFSRCGMSLSEPATITARHPRMYPSSARLLRRSALMFDDGNSNLLPVSIS